MIKFVHTAKNATVATELQKNIMKIDITGNLAKIRYPVEYQTFLASLRTSKAQANKTSVIDFKYSFYWGEMVQSDTFEEISNGIAQEKVRMATLRTIEQKIIDRIENSSVNLVIKANRFSKSYPIIIPVEVINEIKRQEQEAVQEKTRIDSLTSEQKQTEINELLSSLKSSSFLSLT